jgi:HK97 family phage portal protein
MTIIERVMNFVSGRGSTRAASTQQSWRDPALTLYFGGVTSNAGVSVSEETACNYSAFWQAVRLISETIASLPIHVYRRRGDARIIIDDLGVGDMLRVSANPEMTAMQFRAAWIAHALIHGNGYAEIERDTIGRPVRLWLLRPDSVSVLRTPDGSIVYSYQLAVGDRVQIPSEDVLHLRGPGTDGIVGNSIVKQARQAIGLGLAAEQYGSSFFGSGARPSGILEHPGRLSDDARSRLRNDWERLHSGIDNANRTAILEEGMKWTSTSVPPDDAQFLETRKFQLEEIARWFNLPASKLRIPGSSYNSLEQENLAFLSETLRPWLVRIEQECRVKLLDDPEAYIEHKVEGLLRTDIAARYSAYATGRQWGWLSVNEIRALEGLDPVDGGDTYLSPLNMTPINANTEQTPPADQPVDPTIAQSRAIPARYAGMDFTPPQAVRDSATQGLEWRAQYGRGGTAVGVARARDLKNGVRMPPDTIRRMSSYFARHEVDQQATGWSAGEDGFPSAGRIAWELWGGDPGRRWVNRLIEQMDRIDELEG